MVSKCGGEAAEHNVEIYLFCLHHAGLQEAGRRAVPGYCVPLLERRLKEHSFGDGSERWTSLSVVPQRRLLGTAQFMPYSRCGVDHGSLDWAGTNPISQASQRVSGNTLMNGLLWLPVVWRNKDFFWLSPGTGSDSILTKIQFLNRIFCKCGIG